MQGRSYIYQSITAEPNGSTGLFAGVLLDNLNQIKIFKMQGQFQLQLIAVTLLIASCLNVGASSIVDRELKLQNILSAENGDFSILADNADAFLTVPEIIEKYGYPVEIHKIITADGYILEAHRIPYGKQCGPAEGKKVIWLQHGVIADSSNWVINGVEKALGYMLADDCYDVWLGNARGNTYSRNHVSLSPDTDKAAFWSFSFHEMGIYDLPAAIDYVLEITGVDSIYYVGHSMGTSQFFVLMSERPDYNSKIRLASLMAPVAYTEHMRSPIALIAPFSSEVEWLLAMFGLYEFLPSNSFMDFIGATVCHQNSPIQAICSNVLFLICGYDVSQLDTELLPVIMGHTPAGGSARSIVHLSQGVTGNYFRQYDHGKIKNEEIYGQPTPPDYDISNVIAPVALYWGENDLLATKTDMYRLAEELPNLQKVYRVNHDRFNHLDFLWAIDAVPLLNKPVMDFLKNF